MKIRKGVSSIVLLFIILVVSLVSVTWFRANITGGSGQQTDIFRQSAIDDTDLALRNTISYLEASLFFAGMNGTASAANWSGRKEKPHRYRYWYCGNTGNIQIPSRTKVRNTSANFTWRFLRGRIDEMHGIRNTFIYRIGQIKCVEAGIKTPLDTPKNDDFRMGATIRSVNVTATDGSVSRGRAPVTTVRRVMFNRYWYVYKGLKHWLNNEGSAGLKDNVTKQLRQVDDQSADENQFCRQETNTPSDWCKKNNKFPKPRMKQGHIQDLDQAVAQGLEKEITALEDFKNYFGGNKISCSVAYNRKNGYSYPGHDIIKVNVNKNQKQDGTCECVDWHHHPNDPDTDADESEDHCHDWKYQYDCEINWDVVFNTRLDYTLTCYDNKYRSVPRKRLSKVAWSIDLSYVIQERHIGGGTYNNLADPLNILHPPASLRTCDIPNQNPTLCQTQADTVGTVN